MTRLVRTRRRYSSLPMRHHLCTVTSYYNVVMSDSLSKISVSREYQGICSYPSSDRGLGDGKLIQNMIQRNCFHFGKYFQECGFCILNYTLEFCLWRVGFRSPLVHNWGYVWGEVQLNISCCRLLSYLNYYFSCNPSYLYLD